MCTTPQPLAKMELMLLGVDVIVQVQSIENPVFFLMQVAFGMDIDVIGEKDTKFTDAVALSFHGVEEASFDIFHKVMCSSRKNPSFPHGRFFVCTPPPSPGNSSLFSYIDSKNLAFKTPLASP